VKRHVVIVDQSEPPDSLNGIQVFGPYSLMTAEAIMGDINSAASEGEVSLNTIVVAPFNEAMLNLNAIVGLLAQEDDITTGPGERGTV
jgi:hypothetical protein